MKIGLGVSGWQGVKFSAFPSTCVVAITTLSHHHASVWCTCKVLMHSAVYTPRVALESTTFEFVYATVCCPMRYSCLKQCVEDLSIDVVYVFEDEHQSNNCSIKCFLCCELWMCMKSRDSEILWSCWICCLMFELNKEIKWNRWNGRNCVPSPKTWVIQHCMLNSLMLFMLRDNYR